MTKEEAIKIIENIKEIPHIDNMVNRNTDEALSVAINALKSELKHGQWIAKGIRWVPFVSMWWHKTYECSNCHSVGFEEMLYCPNCGAKIDEVG